MVRTTLDLALVVFLTLLGAIAVSGVQLAYVFAPPVPGTIYEVTITALALLAWYRWQGESFVRAPARRAASARIAIGCGICLSGITAVQGYWLLPAALPAELTTATASAWGGASTLIAVSLTAPLLEEALFRGFLLGRFRRHCSEVTSVAISAGVFAIAHFDSSRVLMQFAGGALFASIVIITGRLWLAVVAHGVSNLSGVLEGSAASLGIPEQLGLAYPAIWAMIALLAALDVFRVLRNTQWYATPGTFCHGASMVWTADPIP